MPICGSQIPICDVPIRFDTYTGCTHACEYCFVKRLTDIKKVGIGESPKQLLDFINGKRNKTTSWCDWDIPIHWGGVSDPFQPCEKIHKRSYEALKVFADTQYPYIVSTKGKIAGEKDYIDIISRTNCVFQLSAISAVYDKYEKGASTFEERMSIAEKLAPKVKRVVIRAQPFILEIEDALIENLKRFKEIGVYGVVLEGMKYKTKRSDTEKFKGDNVIKKSLLRNAFQRIKEACHENNIVFLCGENRLRSMGDSLTCCGCEGLEGFVVNTYNLNSFNLGRQPRLTPAQERTGTTHAFLASFMQQKYALALKEMSFKEAMQRYYNKNPDTVG